MSKFVPMVQGSFVNNEDRSLPSHVVLDGSKISADALVKLYRDYDFTTPLIVKRCPQFSATITLDGNTTPPVFFDDLTGFHEWKATHLYKPFLTLGATSVRTGDQSVITLSDHEMMVMTYISREVYGLYQYISEALGIPALMVDSFVRASFYLDTPENPDSIREIRSITSIDDIKYSPSSRMMEVGIVSREHISTAPFLEHLNIACVEKLLHEDGIEKIAYDKETDSIGYFYKDRPDMFFTLDWSFVNDIIVADNMNDTTFDFETKSIIREIDYYAFDPHLMNKLLGDAVLPKLAKLKYRVIQYLANQVPVTIGGIAMTTFVLERSMNYTIYHSTNTPDVATMTAMAEKLVYDERSPAFKVISSFDELKQFHGRVFDATIITSYAFTA